MAAELYSKLKKLKVVVQLVDDRIDLQAPKNVLNAALLNEIKENKEALKELLISYKNNNKKHTYIEQVNAEDNYVLSSAQHRLWILSQFEESNTAYNVPGAYAFTGNLNIEALRNAFTALIDRHEILRTVFKENDQEEVRQFILSSAETGFNLEYKDFRQETQQQELIEKEVQSVFTRPFDLENGPMLRAEIYQTKTNQFVFAYAMHHIISDGWSMGIFIKELLFLYNNLIESKAAILPPLRIHYKDYSVWQKSELKAEGVKGHKTYWLKQFEGELPVFDLLPGLIRPSLQTYNGGSVFKKIDTATSLGLKKISQDQGATLFMAAMTLVNTLLYRYNNQGDIVIGTPMAGREHSDLENQIGFYINTLALRTRFNSDDSFVSLLKKVQEITLGAYEHQIYPFDELVDSLNLQRDMSRNPLFDVMVTVQHNESKQGGETNLGDLQVSPYQGNTAVISKFDFTFNFTDLGNELSFDLEYNSDIYSEEMATQLADHLVELMKTVVKKPTLEILKLEYLTESEKENLLVKFNNTAVNYPQDKTVIDLFEEQVLVSPDSIALIFEEKEFSYNDLNKKSNQLAHYLRDNYKVKPNELIGVELEKSEWAVISILAVLKSGAAYVPIDPIYPKDRKEYMYEDSRCKLILDEKELKKIKDQIGNYSIENLNVVNIPNDLAYLIYTSGTTGNPKGVMIEHNSLFDYVCTFERIFQINRSDRFIQQSSFSFDTHIEEIYPVLIKGGIILMGRNGGQDIQELQTLIEEKGATIISTTPLVFSELNNCNLNLSNLRLMISGGDVFNASYVSNFLNKIEIYDSYGPSESTVCCTYYKITNTEKSGIIGKPIYNRNIYILNDYNQIAPIGVKGEICIGGTGLARGYFNKPELTAEKFVHNPFKDGERMYKTGDLGRWLSDGTIQFLGRKDDQVKIRGYRIELGEIENVLQGHSDIESNVVIAVNQENGQKELVAYIVSKEVLNSSTLQVYLNTKLPKYMIPSHFVQMEQLPLTSNGKIDKRKLPASNFVNIESGIEYVAPRNETEEKLLAIWQEVLKKDKISVKDNFFDLGGQSISATRLSMQIHKTFNNKPALKDLFTFSVLEEQAKWIQESKTISYDNIPVVPTAKDYALSAGQKRLWILSQFAETSSAYNMPGVYVFTGDLNIDALRNAFAVLINRHEILRTVFKQNDQEEVRQFILPSDETGFNLEYKDLREAPQKKELLEKEVQRMFALPFNLKKGSLLRAEVYQTEANQFVFAYAMHHIISDGWSMGVLIKELLYLYNNADSQTSVLSPLPIQYKDYSAWQNEHLNVEDTRGHQFYWLNQFEGSLSVLELGQGKTRPEIQTYNGGIVYKTIPSATNLGIKRISQEQGGTLFMGLLALVNTLLYRYSNQEDIIIGSPIAGREHADLENQIGFYVNTLALRTRFKGEDNFLELLKRVKEVTLGAYEHQIYPFDELVDSLDMQRDMSRNPLFDVMVMLQNQDSNPENESTLGELQVSAYQGSTAVISKFDFTFNFEDSGETLQVSLEYNSDIYSAEIADQLLSHLVHLMNAVIEKPTLAIRQLNYLSDAEKEQLLVTFNATQSPYSADKTIINLLEEQVSKTPDSIALVYQDKTFSYSQLNAKANQFGHYLRDKHGVKPEDLIGIKLERNDWMLVVLLGILKSGGAYLPIDMDYPSERIAYMLADSKCKLLIDDAVLEEFKKEVKDLSTENLSTVNTVHNLAYVIYTSGSTG
ncbi:MAG: amino acid adenylation domain-containing protein, partial [Sporocytophaga sp.]|uniref:non-ribosomal peptide synthetase n=1 Tax=Sporocytophaga sp. TaxID=2231183 RepID=UPI001B1F9633